MSVTIEKLTDAEIQSQGILEWPIWEKEISEFDWTYDEKEQFYVLEGEVFIYVGSEEFHVQPGDFVTCDKELSCRWKIVKDVRKHFNFI